MADRTSLTSERLSSISEHYGSDYKSFLTGLVGTLFGIFDRPNARGPSGRSDLNSAVNEQLTTRYALVSSRIEMHTSIATIAGLELGQALSGNASFSLDETQIEEIQALVGESADEVLKEFAAISSRDANRVRAAWRKFALDSYLLQPRYGVTSNLHARQGKIGELKFKQTDSAGHSWNSALMIQTIVRLHLLRTEVEVALYVLSRAGADTITVSWPTVDGKQDLQFSMSGANPKIPSYIDIRESIFHPNSTARIVHAAPL